MAKSAYRVVVIPKKYAELGVSSLFIGCTELGDDLRMAMRYQHLSSEYLADAVGKLDVLMTEARHQGVTNQKLLEEAKRASA
jgi:hypothetical protein